MTSTTTAAPPKPPARPAQPPAPPRPAQPAQPTPPGGSPAPGSPAPGSAEGEGGDGGFAALLQQTQDAATPGADTRSDQPGGQAGVGAAQADPAALQLSAAQRGAGGEGRDDTAAATASARERSAPARQPGQAHATKAAASSGAADGAADAGAASGADTAAAAGAAAVPTPADAAALAPPVEAQRPADTAPVAAAWIASADSAAGQAALQAALAGSPAATAADASLPTQALPGAFAQAELDVHPGASGFAGALGAQLRAWVEGGVAQARLHLNPRELGPIQVRIALHEGRTRLDLHAQVAATREAIERALPQLQALVAASVADVGVALAGAGSEAAAQADVADGARSGSGQRGQGEQGRHAAGDPTARMAHRLSQAFAQAPQGDAAAPARARQAAAGGLDLYA